MVQHMNMATQWILNNKQQQTNYLILSYGLSVCECETIDNGFSDHKFVIFLFPFQDLLLNHVHLHTCTVNYVTVLDFCNLYNNGSFF